MPTATDNSTSNEFQTIQRPDGKYQQFKKSWSQDRIDKYFTKQGWVKKDGNWFTQTGEPAKMGVPSAQPHTEPSGISTGGRPRTTLTEPNRVKKENILTAYMGQSLPAFGGMIGGTIGGTPGAAFGGAIGKSLQLQERKIILDEQFSNTQQVKDILIEGMKQGALQKAGDKLGDLFFGALKNLKFSQIKDGIPFLPSEYKPNGKVYRYVEDLLSNLAPSARTMEEFKSKQTAAINSKLDTFVEGMSKFKGTSEDMGNLLKAALKSGEDSYRKQEADLLKGYAKKGFSKDQAQRYLEQTSLYKNYMKEFQNQLAQKVAGTNKPEIIAGLLRIQDKAALEETRILKNTVEELKPGTWGKVQNRVMRDMISKLYTGVTDPIAKGTASKFYSGEKFSQILNESGEERLKIIFGELGYKNIEDFVKLTGSIGRNQTGSGVGRFLNLLFIMPFRTGINPANLGKTVFSAALFNRAAKLITSTEGIDITNKYVRATIQHSPQLINLAMKELEKFNQRSDAEYENEIKEGERQYEEEHKK